MGTPVIFFIYFQVLVIINKCNSETVVITLKD
jgi:hypothetical protein